MENKRNLIKTDDYYGPQLQKPDVSSEIFEERKQRYMEELFENARN